MAIDRKCRRITMKINVWRHRKPEPHQEIVWFEFLRLHSNNKLVGFHFTIPWPFDGRRPYRMIDVLWGKVP